MVIMTDAETTEPGDAKRLKENLAKMDNLSKRLLAALAKRERRSPGMSGPGPELYTKAAAAYMAEMVSNPAKVLEHQVSYWGKSLKHWLEAQQALSSGNFRAPEDNTPKDPRFKNELWETHPYFNFVKQQYLMASEAIHSAIGDLDGLEQDDKRRVEFFTRQIVEMLSPSNYLATNPDALERAVKTQGQSLVDGLENLVRDIEANDGELLVSLADKNAFEVGKNIASTEGSVVFRNRLFELIQYTPTTDTVFKTPLVIFPPWINKFYILDLKPANSFIKWAVDQGFTVFVVSWRNPDPSYKDVGLDTYAEEGYLTAIDQVKEITGEKQVNTIGYCIGGTMLSIVTAYLQKKGDKSIRSATLFTTLTDFSDTGELSVFLEQEFVDAIENEVQERGMLQAFIMSRTFSFLRANDLVYGPAIRSYMLGETPPAFDLLYWNGDSTNLPARMAVDYLRRLCMDNEFAEGTFDILGESVTRKDIKVPVCSIACETDHIAEWKPAFNGLKEFGSREKTFILSESGHIAGIINPPTKVKYGHYTSDAKLEEPESWLEGADYNEGSWWPRWQKWVAGRSGAKVDARQPGDSNHPVLAAAPGEYVKMNARDL